MRILGGADEAGGLQFVAHRLFEARNPRGVDGAYDRRRNRRRIGVRLGQLQRRGQGLPRFGQLIAEASTDKEEILVVECDPRRSDEVRRNWPFLRDRRIDAYGPIVNRWLGK